ncbi:hypothetical protein JCM8115_000616 [Rhodotorula mucilaginosa]
MEPEGSHGHPHPHLQSMADKPWRRNLVSLHNPHPSPLSGTQDLISHFHLEPLYDTFLRPYLPSSLSSAAPVDAADQLSVGGASGAHPLAPPSASSTQATTTLPPVPGQVVLPTTTNNNRSKQLSKGAQIKATPASPAPSTPGPAAGGGLKITLGGIKLAGLTSPALATASTASLTAATQKKPKRPKMDKSYDYMVGDVLGRISQPRSSSTASSSSSSSSLLHLVSNPDSAPCPPLHPFDPLQLREAFTLKPGGLAGFDMTIWEARDPSGTGAGAGGGFGGGGGGDERRRKKKKRKHDDPNSNVTTDPKKQRR